MIFDKLFDSLNSNTEKILENEARVRGLDYSEVKADADSGLVIDGCCFGSKYALVRNGKKSVLIPYKELFWVFAQDRRENDRVNVYFVTVYHVMYQVSNMRFDDFFEICKKIRAADIAVLIGFRKEYTKLYDDHPDDLKEVKRQFFIQAVYNELKKDAEERKARGEQEQVKVPEPVKAPEPESVKVPEPEHVIAPEPAEKQPSEKLKAFAKLHAEYMAKSEEWAEKDYVEELVARGYPETAEKLKKYRHNIISIGDKDIPEGGIPVGASKIGGLPDLPPDIEYPTMTGYTMRVQGRSESKTYAKSAMHLVMQINLRELAESGADAEGLFPKTGMFYLFWSGELDDTLFDIDNKYRFVKPDEPELAHINKVIWWDGDMSALRRTEPTLPCYEDVDDEDNGRFDEICPERMIDFSDDFDYERRAAYMIDDLMDILDDSDEYDFVSRDDKIYGIPDGANAPELSDDKMLLLQLDYSVGCVWRLFWIMKKQDFIDRNFDNIHLDADCD